MNDLFEIYKNFNADFNQFALMFAFRELMSEFRQISFTMDYDSYTKGCMSTAMWGLYGDKTNGVCIEIDFEKLVIPKNCTIGTISYVKTLPKYINLDSSLTCIADLRKFIQRRKKQFFFKKLNSWKSENEFRIISNKISSLDISNAISAVYLTSYDSPECLFVERIVNGEVPVKYLHFVENKQGIAIPVVSDTIKTREQVIKAKQNPQNAFYTMSGQAKTFYEEHKSGEHFSLLMESFKL